VAIHDIEDGTLYTPSITNILRDYESGYIDDFDIAFNKVGGTMTWK